MKRNSDAKKIPLTALQVGDVFEPSVGMMKWLKTYGALKPKHIALKTAFSPYDPVNKRTFATVEVWEPRSRRVISQNVVTSETDAVVPARAFVKESFAKRRERLSKERPLAAAYEDRSALQADIYLGSDPEIFVVSGVTNEVIPAWLYAPGKKEPAEWSSEDDIGTLYYDGVQAEFTHSPRHCLQETTDRWQSGLTGIWQRANAAVPFLKPKLSALSVVPLSQEMVAGATQEQIELGCDPSINVWGLKAEQPNARELMVRFAGGHMHFGLGIFRPGQSMKALRTMKAEDRDAIVKRVVRMLDLFSGLVGVSLAAELDNPIRRKYYGLPGEIRLPNHGIEYRTNSNFWLCHPAIAHMFWDISRAGLKLGVADWEKHLQLPEQRAVQDAIHGTDVKTARKMLGTMEKMLEGLYYEIYQYTWSNRARSMSKLAVRTILNGLESAVDDPMNVEKNWLIGQTSKDGSNAWRRISSGLNSQWGSAALTLAKGEKI